MFDNAGKAESSEGRFKGGGHAALYQREAYHSPDGHLI